MSLISGLLAASVFYFYMAGLEQKREEFEASAKLSGRLSDWVVSTRDISQRETISEGAIRAVKMPVELIPANAVTTISGAVGRVASARIFQGQFLLESNVKKFKRGSELAFVLPPDYRAITLKTEIDTGVGNMLKPGDFVDVVANVESGKMGNGMSFMVLRGLKVLAVDQTIAGRIDDNGGNLQQVGKDIGKAVGGANKEYKSVTLAATPDECVRLDLAASVGEIRLVLHSADEKPERLPAGSLVVRLEELSFGMGRGAPAPPPPAAPAPAARTTAAPPPKASPARPFVVKEAPAYSGRVVYVLSGTQMSSVTIAGGSGSGGQGGGSK